MPTPMSTLERSDRMRILIADDDPISRRVLEATLTRWGFKVDVAHDGEEAWQILSHPSAPAMAIVDWMMPRLDGPDLCRRLRETDIERYIYVILLTSKQLEEDLVEGLGAGADDYLTKPFKPAELKVRLRAGNRILELQSELMAARDALRDQATFDALTGAYNRGATLSMLDKEMNRSRRGAGTLTVMMGDVDHFKNVNDTFGHLVGDAVLVEVSGRLRDGVRQYDSVGRYGGEEFLVLLPGCNTADAASLAERLRRSIAATVVNTHEGSVSVTSSFGVASFDPETDGELQRDDLLKRADDCLYAAKHAGRNLVMVHVDAGAQPLAEAMKMLAAGA